MARSVENTGRARLCMSKKTLGLLGGIVVIAIVALTGCSRSATTLIAPKDKTKVSYAIGLSIAANWKQSHVDYDLNAVTRGMRDGDIGNVSKSTIDSACAALDQYNRQQAKEDSTAKADPDLREKASYGVGYNTASNWKALRMDLDVPNVIQGIRDYVAGTNLRMTLEEAHAASIEFNNDYLAALNLERKQLCEKNRRDGENFLKQNQTKPGVIVLPSGLQYKVLTQAKSGGDSPDIDKYAAITYRGTTIDGREVDNSDALGGPGAPCNVSLHSIIHGWTEALQLMKPGDKWQLFIPTDLAYGADGGGPVPPGATLIYTLELHAVLAERPQPTAAQIARENSN